MDLGGFYPAVQRPAAGFGQENPDGQKERLHGSDE